METAPATQHPATPNHQERKAFLVAPHEYRTSEPLDVLGEPCLLKLSSSDTANSSAVVQLTVPKLSGPPLHRHSREDEWFYILEGEITWQVDGQRFSGTTGASAYVPRGTVHTYQNFHDQPARMLVVMTPGGLEQFFESVSDHHKGLTQPDFAYVDQLAKNFGLELLGPPLS